MENRIASEDFSRLQATKSQQSVSYQFTAVCIRFETGNALFVPILRRHKHGLNDNKPIIHFL